MKSVGEIYGEIILQQERLLYCSPEELIVVRERIKILKWVVRDFAKNTDK